MARVGQRTNKPVAVMPPDPSWVGQFEEVRDVVAAALEDRAWSIAHVGSTSIPALWAKLIIDLDLIVADSVDDASYLPDLERARFRLTTREPDWEEHRYLSYSERVFAADPDHPHDPQPRSPVGDRR